MVGSSVENIELLKNISVRGAAKPNRAWKMMPAILAAVCFGLLSCSNPMGGGADQSGAKTAYVKINVGNLFSQVEKSKSLIAPENVHSATLTVTGTGMDAISKTYTEADRDRTSDTLEVKAGTGRKFALEAYNSLGRKVYGGEATRDLAAGETVTVVIAMQLLLTGVKDIATFSFEAANNPGLSEDLVGTIDAANGSIEVLVPVGTDITGLKASFVTSGVAVKVGSTAQVSGSSANDYSANESLGKLVYTVEAEDGTTKEYTVRLWNGGSGNANLILMPDLQNHRLAGINSMTRADSDWYSYQYGWFGYSASDYFKPTKTDMDSWGNVYVGNQAVDGSGAMSMFRFTFDAAMEVGSVLDMGSSEFVYAVAVDRKNRYLYLC